MGPTSSRPGANVVQRGGNSRKVCHQIQIIDSHQKNRKGEEENIGDEESAGGTDHFRIQGVSVHLEFFHASRMQDEMQLLADGFAQDQDSGYLDAAAGAAGAGTDKHQHHQDRSWNGRPQIKIRSGVSRGGNDGAYLEGRMAQSLSKGGIQIEDHQGNGQNRSRDNQEIPAHFLHGKGLPEFSAQNQKIGGKVYSEQNHKHGDNHLQVRRVACHTVVFNSEASRTRSTEGNGKGVEQRHFPR